MRRALVLAALAAPALALAQVVAPAGKVIELDNFNTGTGLSYLNAAHCSGAAQVNLEWNVLAAAGSTFTPSGTYTLYASSAAPATTGDNAGFCEIQDLPNATPPVSAGEIGTAAVTGQSSVQRLPVSGTLIATEAGFQVANPTGGVTCRGEGQPIYVCAHWASGAARGAASGEFRVQVAKPAAPANVNAGSGDTRLHVSWDASAGGAIEADRYVAQAMPAAGGDTISSDPTTATSATLSGLQNGVPYTVRVIALSIGGNPSDPSAEATGTPMPIDDFWETYRRTPGAREDGGCGTGGTGPLALLGVGLLALLRRRK